MLAAVAAVGDLVVGTAGRDVGLLERDDFWVGADGSELDARERRGAQAQGHAGVDAQSDEGLGVGEQLGEELRELGARTAAPLRGYTAIEFWPGALTQWIAALPL